MNEIEHIREKRRRELLASTANDQLTPETNKIRITSKGHGQNTFVYFNDVLLPHVYSAEVDCSVNEFTKISLTISAEVEVDIEFPVEINVKRLGNKWWRFWKR